MRFLALKTKSDYWVANYIIKKINQHQSKSERPFVLGLPTGGTPVLVYKYLIDAYKNKEVSFKNVITFNMDEYVGLPLDTPQSYHTFMYENFFNHIDIPKENINIPNGMAKDINEEVSMYEQKIKSFGGIDLFFGGVGSDGHIAFNEPGSSLASLTRLKTLNHQTLIDNARFFGGNIDDVPKLAITIGVKTLLDANEVVILAHGTTKALAIYHAVEMPVQHMWPVSALQLHKKAIIVCDEPACMELKFKTLKYFAQIEAAIEPTLKDDLITYC